jgi:selenocysteine-specific elongation factor
MPGRRDLVIGTAGHIDHGKTALVRALTGVDTDRLPAEKQRGITIDLGFASLELEGRRVALVDVPGHERFIRNMLAGASGLDLALLVVAADDSVMPQTREHLQILQILGLTGGLIALTKVDLVDPSWLSLVEEDIRVLVAGTFLESAEVVRTSVFQGQGIGELKQSLARLCDSAPDRIETGLFRMAIDRSFTLAGRGTIVTGTVASGEVAVGDELEWFPTGKLVRVRGLHRHDRPVDRVARGARAAINLGGVHHAEIVRGHELATPGYLVPARILSVEIRQLDDALRPLRHRGRYRVHLGTAEVSATLSLLTGDRSRPIESQIAQLILAEPVVAVYGQPFVIREESPPSTLGGGRVLHPSAGRRIRRRDRAELDRIGRLASPDAKTRVTAALASYGLTGWTERGLTRDSGVPISQLGSIIEALRVEKSLVSVPIGPRRSAMVLAEVVEALEDRVLRAIARLHEATPRFSSIVKGRVASALADLENDALVSTLIDRLKAAGRVIADARTVALSGHVPKLSQAERKLKGEILEGYRNGGFSPPDPAEWSAKLPSRASTVADLLSLLVNEEQIVEIGPGFYLNSEAEAELRRRVADRLTTGAPMTMAELRDLLQTSRKFAVPIGEYLDRIGWTEREGDLRTLGPASRAFAASEGGIRP